MVKAQNTAFEPLPVELVELLNAVSPDTALGRRAALCGSQRRLQPCPVLSHTL